MERDLRSSAHRYGGLFHILYVNEANDRGSLFQRAPENTQEDEFDWCRVQSGAGWVIPQIYEEESTRGG